MVRRAVRVQDLPVAGTETGSKVDMADDGLGVTTLEKERSRERKDGQGDLDDSSAEPMCGNNDINENGKRRYKDGGDINCG